jgi:hypothetical protein
MSDAAASATLDDDFWDELLACLEDRRVIAVVETGSLCVGEGAARERLEPLLARRLAERLRLPLEGVPLQSIDEVVRRYRVAGPRRDNLHLKLQQVLKELDVAPPQALLDLAAIDSLDLIVTLSVDDLVTQALNHVRHSGAAHTQVVAFSPNLCGDLAQPRVPGRSSTVFHLLGRISSTANCVISDDDRLEFLHALQDDARRPQLLFDALRDSHLLLLGCQFPDWAARFFLRSAKGERLSAARHDTLEILVGTAAAGDASLTAFLAAFRSSARVVGGEVEDFVAELRRRWQAAHPPGVAATPPANDSAARPGPRGGAVFISYSRADAAAAERLVQALERTGIEVWFDRHDIRPGDPWALAIQQGIERCALFVPVVSAQTQREDRSRAYFWREWNTANEAAMGMAPTERFILPVVIDDTDPYRAQVPPRFLPASFAMLPGGQPDEAFLTNLRELYLAYQRRFGHG